MKFQIFTEIEIFVQKCSRGAQNDRNTLEIILQNHHLPIWSNAGCLKQKMQKKSIFDEKNSKYQAFLSDF